jgi:hypothetical protein
LTHSRQTGLGLRAKVGELLRSDSFHKDLSQWSGFPPRKVVNPLFSFLYSTEELLKWRTVTAIGRVVAGLADEDMESARNVMRRLIWNLNDESGGIGWGSPEAMGEIMASHPKLAEEYVQILISYIRPDGNLIGHPILERGALWGLGRLAQVRPHLLMDSVPHIVHYLHSQDPMTRGLALWMLGYLGADLNPAGLETLLNDKSEVRIFENGELIQYRICDLAAAK